MSKVNISNKTIKILTVSLLIALFALIAIFLYADIMTNFENRVYSESAEHMSPFITVCVKGITYMGSKSSYNSDSLCLDWRDRL